MKSTIKTSLHDFPVLLLLYAVHGLSLHMLLNSLHGCIHLRSYITNVYMLASAFAVECSARLYALPNPFAFECSLWMRALSVHLLLNAVHGCVHLRYKKYHVHMHRPVHLLLNAVHRCVNSRMHTAQVCTLCPVELLLNAVQDCVFNIK